MKSTLTEMRQQYVALSDQARGMVSKAKKESRDFSQDENAAFLALQSKMKELERSIEARSIIQGMEAADLYNDILRSEPDNPHAQRARQTAQAAAYNRFVGESLREMIRQGVSHVSDLREMRSILSTNSTGTVSEVVQDQSFTALLAANMPLARFGLILDDGSDNYQKYPYQSGTLEPALVGEASAIGASSLTISSHNVNLRKFAVIQKLSLETLEDHPPVMQYIAQAGSQGFSSRITKYCFDTINTASGVNTVEASGYSASGFSWERVIDGSTTLMGVNVNPSSIALCVTPQTWGVLAKQTGSGDGQYLQRPAVLADLPVEPTTGITVADGAAAAYLGDFSACRLVVRGIGANIVGGGTRFSADPYANVVTPGMHPINDLYISSGEVGVLLYLRCDLIIHRPDNLLVWQNLPVPS